MSTVELSVSASIGDYYNLLLGREWKEFITQQYLSVERLPVREEFRIVLSDFLWVFRAGICDCRVFRKQIFFFSCSSWRRQKKRGILKLDVYIHARFLVEMLQTLK